MRRLFLILFASIITLTTTASHIVGGEVLYKYLGNDKYEVRLHLFIDCVNGIPGAIALDSIANMTVFRYSDSSLMLNLSKGVKRNTPTRITKLNYDCIALPPNACVDRYEYVDTFDLPNIVGGYIIAFQRCCRNKTLNNVLSSTGGTANGAGATYWTHILDTNITKTNNSAAFKELPPNFLCTNAPLVFDHSAVDIDDDSLVYELYHPFDGATATDPRPDFIEVSNPPFDNVRYVNGYNAQNPIDGSPKININPETGLLAFTPSQQGQYVVGILVKEYRNGILVGITRRDYQFNVLNCQFKVVTAYKANDSICGYKMKFDNNSNNATSYFWDFGDSTTNSDTSSLQSPEYTYPDAGEYKVKLIGCDGNCCDSSIGTITILEPLSINLGDDTTICEPRFNYVIDAKDTTATYLWSTGDTTRSITVTQPGSYWVKASRCNDVYDTLTISPVVFDDFTLPNAFSPNGDGYNDSFPMIDGRLDKYTMLIYNRWGEKMFETEQSEQWDGTFRNQNLPPGVYFVLLRYKDCRSPKEYEYKGSVTLFREK